METLINLLHDFYKVISKKTELIRFRQDPQQVYAVCLYGTILENTSACISLLKNKAFTAIPVLVRNLLEAYVDLANLCNCPEYSKRMQSAFLTQKERVFKAASDAGGENPFLAAMSEDKALESQLKKTQKELELLRSLDLGELSIYERFKRAGLLDMYRSAYALLCQHSHNNLHVLESRHVVKEGDIFHVAFFQDWGKADILPFIDTIAGTAVESITKLFDLLGLSEDLNDVDVALENLRNEYAT